VSAKTSDSDFLPTATARLHFDNGLQARLGYARSIRRPDFTDLNPAITLSLSNNPFVQSGGSAGNPNLKEQKSDSYDATLEYYFHGGYVAVAGYYRQISNRVLSGAATETIGGVDYSVTRPRNLGAADLKGLEISGQYFADFLPGPFSGLGVQGAFTLADSKIKGDDPLAGNPLQGVSKYNYTAGLLYEKYGISGRLVYTYRSKYFASDQTGSISVRPIAEDRVNDVYVPTLLSYVRPAGRLDFNVGYDVTPAIRVDVGGTNVLRSKTRDYLGQSFEVFEGFYDETTYSVGVRIRL
jgi:iron complex outermembrane recepter protein